MKNIFSFLLLVTFLLRPLAAENPPAFGLIFQPGLANVHSSGNNITTNSRFAFEGGLKYSFPLGDKTSLDTRFLFRHVTSNLMIPFTGWNSSFLPEYGIGYNFYLENDFMEYDLSYSFLTFPVTLSHKIIDQKKFNFSVRGGLALSTLLNDNTKTISGILNPFENEYQRNNISGVFGIPLHLSVHENLNLMIEPQFSYMLNDFISIDQYDYRLYGMGLNVGLVYRFFKPVEEDD